MPNWDEIREEKRELAHRELVQDLCDERDKYYKYLRELISQAKEANCSALYDTIDMIEADILPPLTDEEVNSIKKAMEEADKINWREEDLPDSI